MATVHRTLDGAYHPDPSDAAQWTVRDARGVPVTGPPCDRCGACECRLCECHGGPIHERGCEGLSFAYVRLDRWAALCESCARSEGIVLVACSCPVNDAGPEATLPLR